MPETSPAPHGESSTLQGSAAQQLNRSCESCRSLKVRCLPSPSTPNQCQRCAKGKRPCVFVAPQRRRPRKRTDSRVAQLEKEMQMMRSLLRNHIPGEEPGSSDESDRDDVQDRDSADADFKTNIALRENSAHSSEDVRSMGYSPELLITPHPSMPDGGGFSAPPTFSGMPAGFVPEHERIPPADDVIDRGILSLEDAEQLVAYFIHELAFFFPLIVLPSNTTAAQLRQTKPILFLSVIAATSICIDAGLAAVLNREMVRLYSERFFIEGEKSLELVQALLLMIIFYFPPMSPLKLQFYQYTHIASTMALEIGLANKRRVSKKSDRESSRHDEVLAEQARAVLACYHLGSSVAMKTRRPNLLQFNDWMTECLVQLKISPHRTDQHVATWFELQRITDEAMSSFGLDDTSTASRLTESRVQAVLRWFDKRLETWKKNTPSEMLTVPIILEYRYTALAMYELGVGEGYCDPTALKRRYFTLPTLDEEDNVGSDTQDGPLSAIRIDINIKWMNAAHELLDTVLTCSTETMRKLPNIMYTRFGMAVTSLLKIHFSVRTGALGEVITVQAVNAAFYLEALANKLSEASAGGKYHIPSRWYHIVGVKCRDWYEQLEQRQSERIKVGSRIVSRIPSTGTTESISGPTSHTSHGQSQNQGHDLHLDQVPSTMESFPVVTMPPMPAAADGMGDGYVAMGGSGMWAMDSGHNPHFYPTSTAAYQPSVTHVQRSHDQATLSPQFSYEPQRIPVSTAGQHLARAGMDLDGWLPDGSISGGQPLPEF
ncbi:hypothetical protein PDIDSM_5053 [Penicillium digitatum]|nr:hypothetical protein PDIDSM_5053 [Penicillium digitatum]